MGNTSKRTGRLGVSMSTKRWTITYVAFLAFVMLGIAVVNYIVDPYGYFHRAEEEGINLRVANGMGNARLVQYNYLKNHHSEYDGVILGGSKSGYITSSRVDAVSGKRYYGLMLPAASFDDYLDWTRWIAENTDLKHIFICSSTVDVNRAVREEFEDNYFYLMPAALDSNKSKAIEFVTFLYRGVFSRPFRI